MVSRMDKPLTPPSIRSLSASLTPAARRLFESARTEATRLNLELWAVGGTVRDAVVGRQPADVDVAVRSDAAALARAVGASVGGAYSLEERFGTASITLEDDRLDLATLRAERYSAPGALPTVALGVAVEEDLRRRDFNVNSVALSLTGAGAGVVLDPFGGLNDLAAGRFHVLHDRSFEDDATRLWRAARLSVQRDLRPSRPTRNLIVEGANWLDTISGDRLWSEFALIADRGRAGRTLALLDQWGVLEATNRALPLRPTAQAALRHRWRPLAAAQLAAVVLGSREPASAAEALRRLSAPTVASRTVEGTQALLAASDADPDRLEALTATSEEARRAARWLDATQAELQLALRRWERTRPPLTAAELLRMGVPEGPTVGRLLRCLRRGRYLGTLGTVGDARSLVRQHLERDEGAA